MADTSIDWTDKVWNPTTGCTKGCEYCYARQQALMHQKHPNAKIAHTYRNGFEPTCHRERLDLPIGWRKPRRIFVNSMGDLFDPGIPFSFIDKVLATIHACPRHTFQILTKQPSRMAEYFSTIKRHECGSGAVLHVGMSHQIVGASVWPLPNLWLGVSVEDQATANERVPLLLQTPAAVRFLSAEPLRSSIDLWGCGAIHRIVPHQESGVKPFMEGSIDWVIAGRETGPTARPLPPWHVSGILRQCIKARVPFFFKGWGEWYPIAGVYEERECPDQPGVIDGDWPQEEVQRYEDAGREVVAVEPSGSIPYWARRSEYRVDYQPRTGSWYMARVGKKKSGHLIEGREWRQFPEVVR